MCIRDLPDMYTLSLRPCGPRALGIHIRQIPHAMLQLLHKKLKKLDNVKIGNLKKKNRDHKMYLNKMKVLVACKFYYI